MGVMHSTRDATSPGLPYSRRRGPDSGAALSESVCRAWVHPSPPPGPARTDLGRPLVTRRGPLAGARDVTGSDQYPVPPPLRLARRPPHTAPRRLRHRHGRQRVSSRQQPRSVRSHGDDRGPGRPSPGQRLCCRDELLS